MKWAQNTAWFSVFYFQAVFSDSGRRLTAGIAHLHGRKWEKGEMRPCALPHRYGRKREKRGMRPCFLLIYTAAKGEKAKCGRAPCFTDTAAIGKRQSCGRAPRCPASCNVNKVVFWAGRRLSSGYWRRTPPGSRFLIFRRCFQSEGAAFRRKMGAEHRLDLVS